MGLFLFFQRIDCTVKVNRHHRNPLQSNTADPYSFNSISGTIDRLSERADRECQEERAPCMHHLLQDGSTKRRISVENLAEPQKIMVTQKLYLLEIFYKTS